MHDFETDHEEAIDRADVATLHDPRLARIGLATGIASIVLAPIVVGALPAAIGLHSAVTHLRCRRGSRGMAWSAVSLASLGALLSVCAALTWGAILMNVLLQRSAVHQAQSWEGVTPVAWALRDASGTEHASEALRGRVVVIDCFAPVDAFCAATSGAVARFAAAHPDVIVLSWAPDADRDAALAFARACGVGHPVCVGSQSMPEPFSLVAAKPTLLVLDRDGTIRSVVLGRYDESDIAKLVEAALVPAPQPQRSVPRR